ncbi:MAG TPA: hypothetical protein DF296_07165 [Candidatus Margulisbacteria bacterium]|nr:hypothetical protein [Candidatus Margulisiibacteriota bacterium]
MNLKTDKTIEISLKKHRNPIAQVDNRNLELFEQSVNKLHDFFLKGFDIKATEIEATVPKIHKNISQYHKSLEKFYCNASLNDRPEFKKIYRGLLNPYWKMGSITNRVITKPNGYDGDYMVMQYMYDNKFEGTNNFGKLLHKYVVNDRSSMSVRLRKKYFIKKINQLSDEKKDISVLAFASGGALEIYELLQTQCPLKRVILYDQDKEALDFAKERIEKVNISAEIITINENIITLLKNKGSLLDNYKFDYIYCAGLYDYLSDILALRLNKYMTKLLTKDGLYEFGNFTHFPISFFADIAADWRLILRTKDDLEKLIPQSNKQHSFFKMGDQTFCSIR